MLTLFVLHVITSSPVASEATACLDAADTALGDSGNPSLIPADRESARVACLALATAIDGTLAEPDPYVARVLSAWRTVDAAISLGGSGIYAPDAPLWLRAVAEIQSVNVDVAHQHAAENP